MYVPEADDRVQFARAAFGRVVRVLAELEPVQHRQPDQRLRLEVQPLQQLPAAHALHAAGRRRAVRRRTSGRLRAAQPAHRTVTSHFSVTHSHSSSSLISSLLLLSVCLWLDDSDRLLLGFRILDWQHFEMRRMIHLINVYEHVHAEYRISRITNQIKRARVLRAHYGML